MPENVSFYSEGKKIAGHLYLPSVTPARAVVLCHGFAGIKEILLPAYAEAFAKAGFAALVFDYRGFGESEGEPGRFIPLEQVADIRNAVTFMQTRAEVKRDSIGLWGTSFGGANAIHAAVMDARVRAVVVQITFASGERMVLGGQNEAGRAKVLSTIQKVWEREVSTNKKMLLAPDQILTDDDSKVFYGAMMQKHEALKTKIPLLTLRHIIEYIPERAVRTLHVPLSIIGAADDIVCPAAESNALFAAANDPKELHIIPSARHFTVYEGSSFEVSSTHAVAWMKKHLP